MYDVILFGTGPVNVKESAAQLQGTAHKIKTEII
jgi:hypothetical protein